jgi:hypothetical protein
MTRNTLRLVLCMAPLGSVLIVHSIAYATSIRPAMQGVVTCVYNILRSKPGVLGINVYDAGTEKYVIEYDFRDKDRLFTGGIGIHDIILNDGKYFYTSETPRGQPDNHGLVELEFLGNTSFDMIEKCHLAPGFDDTVKVPNIPDPPRQKIDMP